MNQAPNTSYAVRHNSELAAQLADSTTINALVDEKAALLGNQLAINMPSEDGTRICLSYQELRDTTCQLAAGLQKHTNLKLGDRVAILAEASAYGQCLIAYLALLRLGCIMVPVNPRYVDEEIVHALKSTACTAIFCTKSFAPRIEDMALNLQHQITIGDWCAAGWINWPSLCHETANNLPQINGTDLANIIFTSGTTGRPKGVVHTHASALAAGAIYATAMELNSNDVYQHPVPFYTSSGTQFTVMAALWAGATLVTEATFNPVEVLKRVQTAKTTVLLGVPSHLLFLMDEIRNHPGIKLPNLRMFNYGGSVMPQEAIDTLKEWFPGVTQSQNYGMTETGPTGAFLRPEDMAEHAGSTGRPMSLCEIKIIDGAGDITLVGEQGEICVRSPACMKEYYADPKATAETLIDGWVRTGDVGYLDKEGFLFFTDRLKDTINRGGLKIGSIEIEEVLYRCPKVLEAAVIAIPHPKLGEDIAAFIVVREGSNDIRAELDTLLRSSLAGYKVPREINIVAELPKNAMGKILKAKLRQLRGN